MKIRKSGVGIKITRTLQKQYSCHWWRRRGSLGALPYADTHADFPTVHRTAFIGVFDLTAHPLAICRASLGVIFLLRKSDIIFALKLAEQI